MPKRSFGWKPDLPDRRDYHFDARRARPRKMPSVVDLRKECPPIRDQGNLGSCGAFAGGGAYRTAAKIEGKPDVNPSPLFLYYNTRLIEKTVDYDSGVELRDVIKALNKYGAAGEQLWPYKIAKFKTKPPKPAYMDGLKHQAVKYMRLDGTLDSIRSCLAAGRSFIFGFAVPESFETIKRDGKMPLPKPGEAILGGHAVHAVGYDDSRLAVLVANSWGTGWGLKGYFWMPYEFIVSRDNADDFWTLELVE